MNEIQNRLFENLCILRDILDKNGITYYLAFGTLLGAVRHHGFIPWDDDVDIYVDLQDISLLKEVLNKDKGRLKFHDNSTCQDYPYSIPKVVDENTILKEKRFKHLKYECGLYIDVFPLFEIPDNIFWRFYLEKMRYFYYGLVRYYYTNQTSFNTFNEIIKRNINLTNVHQRMERNLRSNKRKGHVVTDPIEFGGKSKYPKVLFSKTKELIFEGEYFKVPYNYDEYLRLTFGNYMQLPPENERKSNHDFYFRIINK